MFFFPLVTMVFCDSDWYRFFARVAGGFCDGEVFCVGRAGFFAIGGASLFATATAAATLLLLPRAVRGHLTACLCCKPCSGLAVPCGNSGNHAAGLCRNSAAFTSTRISIPALKKLGGKSFPIHVHVMTSFT